MITLNLVNNEFFFENKLNTTKLELRDIVKLVVGKVRRVDIPNIAVLDYET